MRTDPGVIFVLFLVGVIVLTAVAYGVLLVARWNANRIRYVTQPRERAYFGAEPDRRFSAVSREETSLETPETHRSVAEIEQEKIHFAETETARALARLILSDELDLTKAVKVGFSAKSGAKYQKYSSLVKEAIEEQRQLPYPALAAQQRERWEPEKVA